MTVRQSLIRQHSKSVGRAVADIDSWRPRLNEHETATPHCANLSAAPVALRGQCTTVEKRRKR